MYLYGASGHAKVIIDILKSQGVSIDGFIDDNIEINELMGYTVFHNRMDVSPLIISIGNNAIRKKIAESIENNIDVDFGFAVHTSSSISENATVGIGTVVMQGAIIQSCASIGKHCIINTGATVDHDCEIEDYVHISPNTTLCGDVHVGEGTQIGAGSVVIPGVRIGKWSLIAAGSVVTKDIPDYVLAAGNRCRVIKSLKNK